MNKFAFALVLGLLLVSVGATNYANVSVTLTNSQSSPTGASFQQMVNVSSAYFTNMSSDGGNIRFKHNSTELHSWLESLNGTQAKFWVLLPYGIPANSYIKINMTFLPKTDEFDGTYAGEAPQLSASYGQYDNGASVFSALYQNFAGTSTPSGWICGGCSINNGVQANFGSYINSVATYGLNASQILDEYVIMPSPATTATSWEWLGYITNIIGPSNIGNHAAFSLSYASSPTCSQNYGVLSVAQGSSSSVVCTAFPYSAAGIASIYWPSSSTASAFYAYSSLNTSNTNIPAIKINIGLANNQGAGVANNNAVVYYFRIRAYPPSGNMPSQTFIYVPLLTTTASTTTIPSTTTILPTTSISPILTPVPKTNSTNNTAVGVVAPSLSMPIFPYLLVFALAGIVAMATRRGDYACLAGTISSAMLYMVYANYLHQQIVGLIALVGVLALLTYLATMEMHFKQKGGSHNYISGLDQV